MAHQLPHFAAGAAAGLIALGVTGTLAAKPTGEGWASVSALAAFAAVGSLTHSACMHAGEPRSRVAASDPVAPPPPSAEAHGGLAGVRQTAEPISHAVDGVGPASAHGPAAVAAPTEGWVLDQVADLGSEGELAAAADMDGATAAVSTRAGPEADPYQLWLMSAAVDEELCCCIGQVVCFSLLEVGTGR